jgi:hypothetical protein
VPDTPDPDLIKVTEIFLIPSSFLVAALGAADTNLHRAAVSVLGLTVSILWWMCSREALAELHLQRSESGTATYSRRILWLYGLAVVFLVGWILSTVVHFALWRQPLGT